MNNTVAKKVTKYRWVILTVIWLLYIVNYMDRLTVTTFLPYIGKDLHLSAIQLGWLGSIFFFGYAIAQFFAGFTADRIGAKKTMSIAILTFTFVTFLTGFVRSFGQFIALRLLLALGEGHHFSPSIKTIANWFPRSEKGRATGAFTTSWAIAPAVTPILVTWIAATFFAGAWRPVFYLMSIPGVLGILILWKFMINTPKEALDVGKISIEEFNHINEGEPTDEHGNVIGGLKYNKKIFTTDAVFWVFCFAWFAHLMVYWGMTTWITTFLVKQHGLNIKTMGLFAALPYFCSFIAQNTGGYLQDKVFHGKIRALCVFAFAGCAPVMWALGAVPKGSTGLLLLCLALGGFMVTLSSASINGFPALRYPKEIVGAATGVSNAIGQFGSFLSPLIAGYIVITLPNGSYDFGNVFIFWAIASLIAAIGILFLNESPRDSKPYIIEAGAD